MATDEVDDAVPDDLPHNALLAIQLDGKGIKLGAVSAGTVCRYVDALRLGLQAAIEIIESVKQAPSPGRRKRWVERMSDLPLVGIQSGCVRILLGAPRHDGLFSDAEHESFTSAVELIFSRLASAAAPEEADFVGSDSQFSADAEMRLLGVVARLMPPKRGPLDRVTFWHRVSVEGDCVSVTLTRKCRDRLEERIDQQTPSHIAAEVPPARQYDSLIDLA